MNKPSFKNSFISLLTSAILISTHSDAIGGGELPEGLKLELRAKTLRKLAKVNVAIENFDEPMFSLRLTSEDQIEIIRLLTQKTLLEDDLKLLQ